MISRNKNVNLQITSSLEGQGLKPISTRGTQFPVERISRQEFVKLSKQHNAINMIIYETDG